jgi:hypothetical protein
MCLLDVGPYMLCAVCGIAVLRGTCQQGDRQRNQRPGRQISHLCLRPPSRLSRLSRERRSFYGVVQISLVSAPYSVPVFNSYWHALGQGVRSRDCDWFWRRNQSQSYSRGVCDFSLIRNSTSIFRFFFFQSC